MATLGTMRARIARELQIDATTFATEIDAAIFTAIARYDDKDFWFLEAVQTTFTLSATTQYALTTILPGRSAIKTVSVYINSAGTELQLRTLEEMLDFDYDQDYTGDPLFWCIDHDRMLIQPKPRQTYTAEVYYTVRASLTASASASGVWTNEAEELVRITAEIDILENRMMDFQTAGIKYRTLAIAKAALDEKTVVRRSQRRLKPWM